MNKWKKVDCLSWSKLMSICFSSNSTPEDFSINILEVEQIIFRIISTLEVTKLFLLEFTINQKQPVSLLQKHVGRLKVL